jgi:hypothetical protein
MRRRRRPELPFVVTVTAFALPFGCGGSTAGDSSGTGGSGTGGSSTGGTGGVGTGGAGTGGTGGVPTGGAGGTTGCPAEPPKFSNGPCPIAPGESCEYDVQCQSGVVHFKYTCSANWSVAGPGCPEPYDFCPGYGLHCDFGWTLMGGGGNPPTQCPTTKPAVGDKCISNPFGGMITDCGYRCDPVANTGWTVASCKGFDTWTDDGACQ